MTNESQEQTNRVVAYIRKSSEDNKDGEAHKQLNSIEYQKKYVPQAVKDYGLTLLREPFEDDKTGYEAYAREGFKEMLQYIQDNKGSVDGIICTEISRLARNFADGGMILWYLQSNLIKRIYTPSKVFTNSSADQLMVAIEFAMSKKSSDDTGYRTKQGLKTKALIFRHPAQPAILGYKSEGKEGRKKWIIDKKTAALVIDVFDQYATGRYTLRQLAEYAYGIGIRSKDKRSKTSKLSANSWRNRLRDEHYIGIYYVEGEKVVGAYKPLIDTVTFYKVQEVISGNEHPKSQHVEYAYSELIKCERCGGLLSGTNKKGITYYRCGKRKEPCKSMPRTPYIPEQKIESDFYVAFNSMEIDQKTWEAAREYVIELNQPDKINLNKKARELSVNIGTEDKAQIDIGRMFVNKEITKSEHDRLMDDSRKKQDLLRTAMLKCENLEQELDELLYQFLDDIRYVTKRFLGATPINKREMIDIFCENLEWKEERLRGYWKKPYMFLVKNPNSSTMLPLLDSIRTLADFITKTHPNSGLNFAYASR